MDLLDWLQEADEFPKFYWRSKEGVEYGACGREESLGPLQIGGRSFFNQPLDEPPWDSFPHSVFWTPKWQKRGIDSRSDYCTPKERVVPTSFLPNRAQWEALVQDALAKMEPGLFKKVVLARRSEFEEEVDPFSLLKSLKAYSQGATLFALSFSREAVFLGASPETLYRRRGRLIEVDALAGTKALQGFFLPKEEEEFALVKHSIEEALAPLCKKGVWQTEDRTHETAFLVHKFNRFCAELKEGICDHDLLAALHPTAALGGFPKQEALQYLLKHEPFERGWYGSPLGFFTKEEAEFLVAIRSSVVTQKSVFAFTGAGIVKGSDPSLEWEELNRKERVIGESLCRQKAMKA